MSAKNLDAFRADLRAWLEENCPQEMRDGNSSKQGHSRGGTVLHDIFNSTIAGAAVEKRTGPSVSSRSSGSRGSPSPEVRLG